MNRWNALLGGRISGNRKDPGSMGVSSPSRRGARALCGTVALLFAASCLLSACGGRSRNRTEDEPLSGSGHVALIDLRGGAPEAAASGGFFPAPVAGSYVALIRTLERLGKDNDTSAIFVRIGSRSFGFHQSIEIADELRRLSQQKKKVFCHAHHLNNSSAALVLRGCDETWLSAAGDVETVGIAAQISYLKGAFDRLGIQPEMLAMGRFKSGGEALTREGPSEASEINLRETLAHLRKIWLSRALENDEPSRTKVEPALEDGPYSPDRARELGLVERIGYEDEAIEAAKSYAKTSHVSSEFGGGSSAGGGVELSDLMRLLAGADERTGGRPRVVVLPLVGGITTSAGGPFSEGGITSDTAVRVLRRLREDESTSAIVVRLDSPGGSPLASDLIWHQMMLTREKKPVVVSVGSMAASGGYYIAAGATKIVASESAIVGSIGVFGGKIVFGPALEKLGVTSHAFPAHPDAEQGLRALHLSPLSPWDDKTRERVRQSMQRIYDLFVERVAEGRKMDKAKVYATAEGEIFLAPTGKERGLVDEVGGVTRAIALAKELAKLPQDAPVTVEGPADSVLDALLLGSDAEEDEVRLSLERFRERQRAELLQWFPSLEVAEKLRPMSAFLSPLLAGEEVIAALPYALVLE